MYSAVEILRLAGEYHFDEVREYLEAGGNREVYDGYGNSLLSLIIKGYYAHEYLDPDEAALYKKEEEEARLHSNVDRYSRVPLDERPHRIKEQIEYLLDKGIGINSVGWQEASRYWKDSPMVETPLLWAVVYMDYGMVKYLLEKGADPGVRMFSDEDYSVYDGQEYWLMDHLAYYLLDDFIGDAAVNIVDIMALLMHHGLEQWSGLFDIDVDHERRIISIPGYSCGY